MWAEQLPPRRRTELLTALALANPRTDLLVLDSPDRHGPDPADWLPRLEALAYDGGRPLAVVATVTALPDSWTGPAAAIGNAVIGKAVPKAAGPEENEITENQAETEDAK
jgi:hypothetical protein